MKKKPATKFSNETAYLKNILLNTPSCIYWKDLAGIYMGCNRVFLDMVGLSDEAEVIGKTDQDFCWKNQANDLRKHDLSVIESNQPKVLEEAVDSANGDKKFYSVIKQPLYDEEGHMIGIIGTSMDITDRKALETQLRTEKVKTEVSRTKSKFIANMSHDIRTPIAGMLGMSQKTLDTLHEARAAFIQTPAESAALLTQVIETISSDQQLSISAIDELLTLCNEIIDVVRLESGKTLNCIEVFDLEALLQHTVTLLKPVSQDKGLALLFHLDAEVPCHLKGARLCLDRILLNLTSNALKFTKQGFVKIRVGLAKEQSVSLPFKVGDTVWIDLCIQDSGIGILLDKQAVIFENFSRLSPSYKGIYKGTGLGLYSVKKYVAKMGG